MGSKLGSCFFPKNTTIATTVDAIKANSNAYCLQVNWCVAETESFTNALFTPCRINAFRCLGAFINASVLATQQVGIFPSCKVSVFLACSFFSLYKK